MFTTMYIGTVKRRSTYGAYGTQAEAKMLKSYGFFYTCALCMHYSSFFYAHTAIARAVSFGHCFYI